MTRSFLPSMLANNHGHIVSISSLTGVFGSAGLCDYSSSKAAVIGFDSSLRLELVRLKKTGVKTTCVCPYLIDTGMFQGASSPFIPYLKPEYVADRIVEAILTNQTFLILPRIFYLAYLFKGYMFLLSNSKFKIKKFIILNFFFLILELSRLMLNNTFLQISFKHVT